MKTYKAPITALLPNQVFVFGSNTQGRHGKGAAKWALDNAGAVYGVPQGVQGQSYAIITKDLTKRTHPSRTKEQIIQHIAYMYAEAEYHPENEYLVAYTIKPNLNGYTPQDMADMFVAAKDVNITEWSKGLPSNVIFEEEFAKLLKL